jgi:hypothetical protein
VQRNQLRLLKELTRALKRTWTDDSSNFAQEKRTKRCEEVSFGIEQPPYYNVEQSRRHILAIIIKWRDASRRSSGLKTASPISASSSLAGSSSLISSELSLRGGVSIGRLGNSL